jgi:hypothetical protein
VTGRARRVGRKGEGVAGGGVTLPQGRGRRKRGRDDSSFPPAEITETPRK